MASSEIAQANQTRPRGRRWLQFRLRSLLGLMLTVCLLLGWFRWHVHSYERQHQALKALARLDPYIGVEPGTPRWLAPFVATEVYQDVTHVSFQSRPET